MTGIFLAPIKVLGILGLGVPELVIILVIILIIFGPRKLPQMGRAIGQSVRELRRATKQADEEDWDEEEEEEFEEEEEEEEVKPKRKRKKKAKKKKKT